MARRGHSALEAADEEVSASSDLPVGEHLAKLAAEAEKRGDMGAHAALHGVAVALAELKVKAQAALSAVPDDTLERAALSAICTL